ncbi:cocaine- and amphetamine-regulated transcript protein [Bombina bombina]|uniref:cocaine- and amphetamine-regulated transcript protein n=1 Tax=Bombina bombina TaxID=8345 RepID=UPI00235B2F22|nr:cocaine- and amphetamine-regulated transcript protein [Bombina bombina]
MSLPVTFNQLLHSVITYLAQTIKVNSALVPPAMKTFIKAAVSEALATLLPSYKHKSNDVNVDSPHPIYSTHCSPGVSRARFSTTESSMMHLITLLGTYLLLLITVSCQDTDYVEPRAVEFYSPIDHNFHEKELIDALQEVLEKLKSKRISSYEKKFSQVPMCDAGEQCAVRKGARIGKLCDCPRRTSCNTFLLKCL